MKIYRARLVLPLSAPPIEDGAVAVEEGVITAVGPAREFSHGEVDDLGDVILMPGLINAHCHLDYTVMKGAILSTSDFSAWVRRINELKRTLSDDDYLDSIARGFQELRRWGTTSVFNIESFPELMVRMPPPPLRTWWFYEMIDVRARLHTEDVVAGALTFFEGHPNWIGGFGLSPHAPYTVSADLFRLAKACCEQSGMPWMTHLAETEDEFAMFTEARGTLYEFLRGLGRPMDDVGGVSPVESLFGRDLVPRRGILTHMNWLKDGDERFLRERAGDITVVHCPKCHAYFDRPRFDLDRFRALGVPVCLGTDSLASNNSLNLFEEMRMLRYTHPHVSSAELIDMVTRRPARAIGWAGKLGEIQAGACADLIALPYSGPAETAFDAVVENRQPVAWMLVAGRPVSEP